QLAVLEGRSGDVHGASRAQRDAVSAAVAKASALAAAAGVHPDRDALTQTFEALSLSPEPPEPLGRLTRPLRPGGFEMLTGVTPKAGVVKQPLRLASSRGVRLQADREQARLKPDITTAQKRKREAAIARKL